MIFFFFFLSIRWSVAYPSTRTPPSNMVYTRNVGGNQKEQKRQSKRLGQTNGPNGSAGNSQNQRTILPAPESLKQTSRAPPRARISSPKSRQHTILSGQLASLSTGLGTKSRLLEAKRGGSRRPEAWKNPSFLLGIPMISWKFRGIPKNSYPVVIINWVQYLGPPGPFSFPDSRDLLEVLGGLSWQRERGGP